MKKVLIIKLGYSETLVHETDDKILSLGDVLRTTVILNLYRNDQVTWITNKEAFLLLKRNPFIYRLMDIRECSAIINENFDIIINLEKSKDAAILADTVKGQRRYGFTFYEPTGEIIACNAGAQHALDICHNKKNKIFLDHQYWEEILFEIVGETWQGEMPQIACKATSKNKFDIGFNHKVGKKWPTKAWPDSYWKQLELFCRRYGYTVSWQTGLESIEDYISWINSCRLIVTNDSLGFHIAHALDKKIVALFGPTLASEVYVKDGVKILPKSSPPYPCLPCLDTVCTQGASCMFDIAPIEVIGHIIRLLK